MKTIDLPEVFNGLDPEKKFDAYRKLWHQSGAYEILPSFPLHLDIELSGVCNLKCEFCFQNGLIDGPLGLMSYDLYRDIITTGVKKGLCAVKLQIRGESFLHPDLYRCIRFAKDQGIMDIQITTNGTLLNEKNRYEILNSGIDAVILSVDEHHGDSFTDKRKKSDYSAVESAIDGLLALRKKLGKTTPWVRLRTLTENNDTPRMNRLQAKIKQRFPLADIVTVGRIHDFRDDRDAYPDLRENYILNPCTYPMQRLAVFWNGDVTLCCMDYNNRFALGNVEETSIEEIWLSERMNRIREQHLAYRRDRVKICKHCHVCTSPRTEETFLDRTPRHMADYSAFKDQ